MSAEQDAARLRGCLACTYWIVMFNLAADSLVLGLVCFVDRNSKWPFPCYPAQWALAAFLLLLSPLVFYLVVHLEWTVERATYILERSRAAVVQLGAGEDEGAEKRALFSAAELAKPQKGEGR